MWTVALSLTVALGVASQNKTASRGPCGVKSCTAGWEFAGPATYYARGDPNKITSAGAINNAVVSSDTTGDVWFVGTVNGGVWKTESLSNAIPKWVNVLDGQPVTCSSIAALHVSAADPNRIYAGCGGSTSSEEGHDWNVMNSGEWTGVMMSSDRGETWTMTGFPPNWYVTGVIETAPQTLLVSAQSHLFDAFVGGIWRSTDAGVTWNRVSTQPTFTLLQLHKAKAVLATHGHSSAVDRAVSISVDGGVKWSDFTGNGMSWGPGTEPFYTCATLLADGDTLVLGGLTVLKNNASVTNSAIFSTSVSNSLANGVTSWSKFRQPTSMDEDAMPKDRMALLGDPEIEDLFYVAGNAGALAWRANTKTGVFTQLWDKPDVTDGSLPHGDCRNYAWDKANSRLVLVSDGGIFARFQPRTAGGRWVSLNGDITEMEYLTANYDPRGQKIVAGAQDNCAQVFYSSNRTSDAVAIGFVEGDGTVTLVDNVHNPARLYGTTQFMGVGTIDIDPNTDVSQRRSRRDDDDDCGGLCFVQGDDFIGVPLAKYFPEPSSFPYFVQPYQLNAQDPSKLVFWANGTASRPSAFYEFSIPDGVKDSDDIHAPSKILETPPGATFLAFVSGGWTGGKADQSLLLGMSNVNLYVRSTATGGKMVTRPLPAPFAAPVTLDYASGTGARILGPLSHGSTVSLAVSPSDSAVVAVTGWPSVNANAGPEAVFVSHDAGKNWINVSDGLREAAGVVGRLRTGGLLIIDLLNNHGRALLASTSTGVMVRFLSTDNDTRGSWMRLGGCSEFPIVLNAGLSYEHYSDTLIAATMGRGVYKMHGAKQKLLSMRDCAMPGSFAVVPEESSAKYFPPQK